MLRKNLSFAISIAALVLSGLSRATATSVVVQLHGDRITIAADTLARRRYSAAVGPYSACKIVATGKSAFAVAGNIDYRKTDPMDTVAEWDARLDARQSFDLHPDDIPSAAEEWAARAAQHYASFLAAQPGRVRELADANPQHVLVLGTFTGWDARAPIVLFEWVYLDLANGPAIQSKTFLLPARKLPYTTNATTQELIEGSSQRTLQTLLNWQSSVSKYPRPDRGWRWLEFLIQSTSQYDDTVGRDVNVLELTPNGNSRWLQNSSCGSPSLSLHQSERILRPSPGI